MAPAPSPSSALLAPAPAPAPAPSPSPSPRTRIMALGPPRMSLRRTASYNSSGSSPTPLSATSSRFSFNHLLFSSPPPSPSLPALVPRPPRRRSSHMLAARPVRLLRRLLCLSSLAAALYLVAAGLGLPFAARDWSLGRPRHADVLAAAARHHLLPDAATPIVVSDSRKSARWTVSIPHHHDFPLSIKAYAEMTARCREVSALASDLHRKTPLTDQAVLARDKPDAYFVDVDEAQRTGMLPAPASAPPLPRRPGHFVGLDWESMAGKPVCESSLTFVLESPEAGLGSLLMTLWTLYALAREQGRAFFLDDSRWAYGAYADMFQPPPLPDCRPPPRHHMVPCPVQARHLVVSAVTTRDVLPALLAKHRRTTGASSSQRDLLELARTGYRALFILTPDDQDYVDRRIKELRRRAQPADAAHQDAPVIGLHVRRGDRHPLEYQYRDTYIPSEVFLAHAQHLAAAHYNKSDADDAEQHRTITVVASDDPMVHQEAGMSGALLAQQRIRLASKEAMEQAAKQPDPHVLHHFVEDAQGWEGGFFALMFWNLGAQRQSNAAATAVPGDEAEPSREPPSEETLRLRSLVGRAYMMDLAVLAGASDRVVCAVSAMGCRLLGVMMGWERGIEKGDWVNIDGGYSWSGLSW